MFVKSMLTTYGSPLAVIMPHINANTNRNPNPNPNSNCYN